MSPSQDIGIHEDCFCSIQALNMDVMICGDLLGVGFPEKPPQDTSRSCFIRVAVSDRQFNSAECTVKLTFERRMGNLQFISNRLSSFNV